MENITVLFRRGAYEFCSDLNIWQIIRISITLFELFHRLLYATALQMAILSTNFIRDEANSLFLGTIFKYPKSLYHEINNIQLWFKSSSLISDNSVILYISVHKSMRSEKNGHQ